MLNILLKFTILALSLILGIKRALNHDLLRHYISTDKHKQIFFKAFSNQPP